MTYTQTRLLILSEYFEPSASATAQIATDLATDLTKLSFDVTVLTSTAGTSRNDFEIVRLNNHSRHSSLVYIKALSGILFLLKSLAWAILHRSRYDKVLIFSNPPFAGVVGLLLKLLFRKTYLFVLQDLFPRSASLTGILPSKGPIVSFWRLVISLIVSNSKATVVLSESMRKRAISEYLCTSKFTVIPNWSVFSPHPIAKSDVPLTSQWQLNDSLVVQYSGNFGRLHDFMTVLEAARLTQEYPIKYLFIGDGPKQPYLDAYISNYKMTNVILKPFQPRSRLIESLAVADISLVTLIPGAYDTVAPCKFYGILASARPVLFVGNPQSEIAQFIASNHCGFGLDIGDVHGLVTCLLRLLNNKKLLLDASHSAYKAYTNNFGIRNSSILYANLLTNT